MKKNLDPEFYGQGGPIYQRRIADTEAQEQKHTPGPWSRIANLNENSELYPLCSIWAGSEMKEHIICNSCSPPNARLIAAAPELLEALEKLETLAEADVPNSNIDAHLNTMFAVARAAIQKAEGKCNLNQ